jgi:hypothetical protein
MRRLSRAAPSPRPIHQASAPDRSIAKGLAIHWAIVCSLTATAKLNDRKPYAYLKEVLERMTNDHPASRLDDLLPWNWKPPA